MLTSFTATLAPSRAKVNEISRPTPESPPDWVADDAAAPVAEVDRGNVTMPISLADFASDAHAPIFLLGGVRVFKTCTRNAQGRHLGPDREATTIFGEALQQLRAICVRPNQRQLLMRNFALPENREHFAETRFLNSPRLPWAICEMESVGERVGFANQFF